MGHQYSGADTYPSDYTIPDDGDTLEVASVNVAFEALGDRTEWLRQNRGIRQLVGLQTYASVGGYNIGGGGAHRLTVVSGAHTATQTVLMSTADTPGDLVLPVNTEVGDIVEITVSLSCNLHASSTASNSTVQFDLEHRQNGGAINQTGMLRPVMTFVGNNNAFAAASTADYTQPIMLTALAIISVAGSYAVYVDATLDSANASYVEVSNIVASMKVLRELTP